MEEDPDSTRVIFCEGRAGMWQSIQLASRMEADIEEARRQKGACADAGDEGVGETEADDDFGTGVGDDDEGVDE